MRYQESFLPTPMAQDIERELTGPNFAWNYNPGTVTPGSLLAQWDDNTRDVVQFTHVMAYENQQTSAYYPMVYPLIYFLDRPYKIQRLKANMTLRDTQYPETHYTVAHRDSLDPQWMSLLYYVQDSSGPTRFFDDEGQVTRTCQPRKNSAILFPSRTLHAGSPPTLHDTRVVLNFILEPV